MNELTGTSRNNLRSDNMTKSRSRDKVPEATLGQRLRHGGDSGGGVRWQGTRPPQRQQSACVQLSTKPAKIWLRDGEGGTSEDPQVATAGASYQSRTSSSKKCLRQHRAFCYRLLPSTDFQEKNCRLQPRAGPTRGGTGFFELSLTSSYVTVVTAM